MRFVARRSCAVVAATTFFVVSMQASAQQHVVPLAELQSKVQAISKDRAQNIADIERVLSYPAAVQALEKSGVKQEQVRTAVATLSNDELARFAEKARASENDVQGGLLVGVLALIGLIVVILIIIAIVADARPAPGSDLPSYSGVENAPAFAQAASVDC
jgi:hypothetical protein